MQMLYAVFLLWIMQLLFLFVECNVQYSFPGPYRDNAVILKKHKFF
jgi:hypothetical protein